MSIHFPLSSDPSARRQARRCASAQRRIVHDNAIRWLAPACALAGPLLGDKADVYLQMCLLVGAGISLWRADRTGAVAWIAIWSLVTAIFSALLLMMEVPAFSNLAVLAWTAALSQAIALLGVGAPATIADWRARGLVLASMAGPLALALLAIKTPDAGALAASVAAALNLAGLPLALLARRRAYAGAGPSSSGQVAP
ncbi:hypothetical protein SGCZBJ_01940 [Caulobacter zeae]|uniref:Uncharacterized protein n=1 Tax=Caulobacter zeae TaxID=2055137 RepID=A0A2N5DRE7_9CAUL|nr:hypothetical protein [Caulobacter zeae]PLR28636.1 hypothetical protein SGCZBJ_01940 [Caulobacter zeae]